MLILLIINLTIVQNCKNKFSSIYFDSLIFREIAPDGLCVYVCECIPIEKSKMETRGLSVDVLTQTSFAKGYKELTTRDDENFRRKSPLALDI